MKQVIGVEFRQEAVLKFLEMTSYQRAKKTASVGVDKSVWSRWERGERSPSLKKIQEVAPLLGLNTIELVNALENLQRQQSLSSQSTAA